MRHVDRRGSRAAEGSSGNGELPDVAPCADGPARSAVAADQFPHGVLEYRCRIALDQIRAG